MSKDNPTRRKVLKSLGVTAGMGFAGAAHLGGTAKAAGPSVKQLDEFPSTDFNPNRKQDVHEFVKGAFESTEALEERFAKQKALSKTDAKKKADEEIDRERDRLIGELSPRQKQAIGEVMKKVKVVARTQTSISVKEKATPITAKGNACGCYQSHTATGVLRAEAVTPVGSYRAFDYFHKITWEGNHDWPADVRAMNANTWADDKNYPVATWVYKGSNSDDITEYTNYFVSDKTGRFDACWLAGAGWACPRTDYGFIQMAGSAGGRGFVAEKYVNTP